MEKIFFFSLLLLIIFKKLSSRNITKIPFKFYPTNIFFPNQIHPLANRYMSQIAIELSIGTPPQKLNLTLILNQFHSLFLNNEFPDIEYTSIFNKSSSSTYNCTTRKKYYIYEDFGEAEIFKDHVNISENENLDFNFLLIYELAYGVPNEFYSSGIIGLRMNNENSYNLLDENRFLYQIKNYNLSRTEVFYFDFDNEKNDDNYTENGYFVIGEDLFDDVENFLQIKAGYMYFPNLAVEWAFNFDAVYFGNTLVKEQSDALIKTENGLIVGPTYYENIIKEFFKNTTKCFSNYIKMGYATYRYYYCHLDFDENIMEDLIFELNSINYSFILNGTDLFFQENGVKYFKILFLYYSSNNIWYLGRNFLQKYKLRFDSDRKLIYIPLNKNKEEIPVPNEEKELLFYEKDIFWIIIGLGILAIGLIIFIIFCLKKYPRKKRANEIEDDGDYEYKKAEEKEGIN